MDFALLILIVSLLVSKTASSGDLVFVQTGSSVQLDIQQEKRFIKLIWLNDESEHLVRFTKATKKVKFHTSYMERTGFDTETFSLTLRDMQKTDSGIYRARATGDQENDVAEHNVLVLDPVKTPVLTLLNYTMIGVNSCIVDVTCFGHDLALGSSYYSNCSDDEVTSLKKHTLALYCKEDVVVCNYSNPVSWKTDTIEMKQLCTTHENVISEVSIFFPLHWLIVFVLSVLLAGAAVSYCSYRKYKKGTQLIERTIYAEVEPGNKVQRDLEMSERSQNPHTVHSSESLMQGQHNKVCKRNCHIYNEVPERINAKTKRGNNHPKTTYCKMGRSVPEENNLSVYCMVTNCETMDI